MSRRRVTALSFAAAVIVGAAAGLLFGLLWAEHAATPISVTDSVTPAWPAAYRCGVAVQPEDLDRADRCGCGEKC